MGIVNTDFLGNLTFVKFSIFEIAVHRSQLRLRLNIVQEFSAQSLCALSDLPSGDREASDVRDRQGPGAEPKLVFSMGALCVNSFRCEEALRKVQDSRRSAR